MIKPDQLPPNLPQDFECSLSRKGIRIERIVSTGQSTPVDAPYDQDHDEWILLLQGAAGLWIDGQEEHDLRPGDHLLISAHHLHRVTWTAKEEASDHLARRPLRLVNNFRDAYVDVRSRVWWVQ
jgi:cupin 2 domain-containing protein